MLKQFEELAQQLYSISLELQQPNMQIFTQETKEAICNILTSYTIDADLLDMKDVILHGYPGLMNYSDVDLLPCIEEAGLNHIFDIAIPAMSLMRDAIVHNAQRGIK